jgi:hypothetical protein
VAAALQLAAQHRPAPGAMEGAVDQPERCHRKRPTVTSRP